jgi:pimeloyl-ACP methyl ester carboxylesterase
MSIVHSLRPTRRQILRAVGTGVAGVAVPGASASAQSGRPRRTFVLVHGAWHGGWCWRRVADRLQAAGHTVYTPTLTGLGERSHLINRDINLDTHITDVVNVFKWEGVANAVLCGHSYGGWVISGATEQVLPQVASIVFLDAFVPRDGQTGLDIATPTSRDGINLAIKNGAISRPPPTAESFKVNEKDRAWVDAKMTPQPIGVSLQKIRLTGALERVDKKAYVRAANYPSPTFDGFFAAAKTTPGWRTYAVPSGHDVMVEMPERLAEVLLELA